MEETLPQAIFRNLGDRSYEKRKTAALEIEKLIKDYNGTKDQKKHIVAIITMLRDEFIESTQANQRKGGLIGLAATSIGLMKDTSAYLETILPPVLGLLKDQESRVRYYACESLYNITKVTRGDVLRFFNQIFDGLCTLYADVDIDVKNGAQLLDRLIKDVVTECDAFDVEKFIPLLRERIRIKNPFIRQLMVGWITVLDAVPDIDMLAYLPQFLGGLFDMLSDAQKDIRQQANSALAEFLREIRDSKHLVLGPMIMILVDQCRAPDKPAICRVTALQWMYEFIELGQTKLLPYYADMLGAVLHCISSEKEQIIRKHGERTNHALIKLVKDTNESFEVSALLEKLISQLSSPFVPTRMASLAWISMLLKKVPKNVLNSIEQLYPVLLRSLSDSDINVVHSDLEVLSRIALHDQHFTEVLKRLLKLFCEHRDLLASRGSVIIQRLSVLLDGEKIYRAMASILQEEEDSNFASIMVQTLNLILLTSSELFRLRTMLKDCLIKGVGRDLFIALYNSWCHNPVAALSLCLLTQAYELGSSLVFHFADIEVTVGFLMQIDKLVQLVESPIFIHLRLQLLEPERHPFLLKIMYGILMILPQSSAFVKLTSRLQSVSQFGLLNCIPSSKFAKSQNPSVSETKQLDFPRLLEQFTSVQKVHVNKRKAALKQISLLPSPSNRSRKDEKKEDG
uniref:Protein VAC14 homolog n=1 Tax=Hirondellea gigas TaxID=1518452 RepID=A0A6A7GC16_9CRUS